ncbi:VanZ family protein [Paenibacillus sp. FSL E2-8871]|uniref:VanZ family protein n=1 Tax=Paenibacillus sp. FSL E2-8871 TaxID=2975326 RepID=UPI0030F6925F
MRIILLLLWGIALLVFTSASNSGFWGAGEIPFFHWKSNADYHNLLKFDLKFSTAYIGQKIGHFTGFAIFAVLLKRVMGNYRMCIAFSVTFAVLTEVIQLYFGRDGRLYDIVIDSLGILLGLVLVWFIRIKSRNRWS